MPHSIKSQIVLSFPQTIDLAAMTGSTDSQASKSWIQVAKTGAFTSGRYGKFSITREDLAKMLYNFQHVTPKAPTQLPVDYDHLSMDPKKPGDGAAAGWIRGLELRHDGDELWAEVEWTPDAATRIANREYRFVSPSFVKDYQYKDGTKIGTTLLAAAITNHPFLEGMAALTLYNFSAMGDLALSDDRAPVVMPVKGTIALMQVGQRVTVTEADELSREERVMTFEVREVIGEGDDAFAFLNTLQGRAFGWFRALQLAPARAPEKETKETIMNSQNPTTELLQLTNVIERTHNLDYRSALLAACRERPDLALAHRDSPEDTAPKQPKIASSADGPPAACPASEALMTLANQYVKEKGMLLRDAMIMASAQMPAEAEAYRRHFVPIGS